MSNQNLQGEEHISPPVVRTLKPPPEIWELVHPVEEPQLNPRQTFLKRLFLFVIVGGLVVGVGTAVWKSRGVETPARQKTQPLQVDSTFRGNKTTNPPSAAPPIDSSMTQPAAVSVSDNSRRATSRPKKRKAAVAPEVPRSEITSSDTTTQVRTPPPPKSDQQSGVAADADAKKAADSASAKPKSNLTVGPLMIAPPKAAATPKAKVIQWP